MPRVTIQSAAALSTGRTGTKPITLVAAVLLWAAAASPSLAITYTTLDDPLATRGTHATGISDNNIVEGYSDIGRSPREHSRFD